ncbi:hypothetical protein LCGC14_0262260 [marine sediment metagenome]|uniref:Uncharacterized protein n=1 Tax=marine sediment metagenome TaxID=412755 RepID=A0A0F9UHW9_9ZZZZ
MDNKEPKKKKFLFELPSWTLLPRLRLPRIALPRRVLPKRWFLPRIVLPAKQLLPERMLPRIRMPHVLIDFPEEVSVPWKEMEIERVEVMPLKPRDLKIIFRRIPDAERQTEPAEATP